MEKFASPYTAQMLVGSAVAASATHAADKIYSAVNAGRAEITITPQAWLAARIVGLAPETSQIIASLASQYLLPRPAQT